MTEDTIQFAMWCELLSRNHKIVCPNVSWSWLHWEADLISVTQANYWHEYEIKCSKRDFIKDFDKFKHRYFRGALSYPDRIPNYFWYVAPIEAIPLCIPHYAGLILVKERDINFHRGCRAGATNLTVEYVKKAVMLHGNKLKTDGCTSILRSVMFKYWNQRQKYYERKAKRD